MTAPALPGAPFLAWRGTELTLEGHALDALASEFGTPLYVYSRAAMRHALAAYRDALQAGTEASFSLSQDLGLTAFAQYAEQRFKGGDAVRDSRTTTLGGNLNWNPPGLPWSPSARACACQLDSQEDNQRPAPQRPRPSKMPLHAHLRRSVTPLALACGSRQVLTALSAEVSGQRRHRLRHRTPRQDDSVAADMPWPTTSHRRTAGRCAAKAVWSASTARTRTSTTASRKAVSLKAPLPVLRTTHQGPRSMHLIQNAIQAAVAGRHRRLCRTGLRAAHRPRPQRHASLQTQGDVRVNGAPGTGRRRCLQRRHWWQTGVDGRVQMRTGRWHGARAGLARRASEVRHVRRTQHACSSRSAAGGLRAVQQRRHAEWRVELARPQHPYQRLPASLQACGAGCALAGKASTAASPQGDAVLEYQGGRSVLRSPQLPLGCGQHPPRGAGRRQPALLDDLSNQADATRGTGRGEVAASC